MQSGLEHLLARLEVIEACALTVLDVPALTPPCAWLECRPGYAIPRIEVALDDLPTPHCGWLLRLDPPPPDHCRVAVAHLFIATALRLPISDGRVRLTLDLCTCWWQLERLQHGQSTMRHAIHALRNGLNAVSMCAHVLSVEAGKPIDEPHVEDLLQAVQQCLHALDQLQPAAPRHWMGAG